LEKLISGLNWGQILRDQSWGAVGVLFALIALIVAWLAFRSNRRALSYHIVAKTPLVTKGVNGLQVTFNGNPVRDAHLLIIRLINTGRSAIESSNFEEKLSITFDKGIRVLAADVIAADPDDLLLQAVAGFEPGSSVVVLEPLLLNVGDTFDCRIVVNRPPTLEPALFGRIVGVKKIAKIKDRSMLWAMGSVFLMFISMAIISLAPRIETIRPTIDPRWSTFSTVLILAATLMMLPVVLGARGRQRMARRLRGWN
jgi:cobalamin synthase